MHKANITLPMPNPRDDLAELVHSLHPAEKRYVRIFAGKHFSEAKNKYLLLFDKLLNGGGKTGRASEKTYLHAFILKALRSYHESASPESSVREMLIDAKLLLEKRLYAQSLKQLQRARKTAQRFDLDLLLAAIIRMEMQVHVAISDKTSMSRYDALEQELVLLMDTYPDHQEAALLEQRLQLLQRRNEKLTEETYREYGKKLDKLISRGTKGRNFTLLHNGLFARARLLHSTARYIAAAAAFEELIALWEIQPDRIAGESMLFKKILFNYLITCHRLERFAVFPPMLARIRRIPCRTTEEQAEEFQNLLLMELLVLMNTDGYDQLPRIESEISRGLSLYRNKISKSHELTLYHNISVAHFICENWKASAAWLEKIMQEKKTQQRLDLQCFARLLRLVLWYEMGKHELLEYETINAERYLRKNKSWSLFENIISRLVGKLAVSEKSEKAGLFSRAAEQLLMRNKKTAAAPRTGFDELYYWVKSRETGLTIRETIRRHRLPTA